ncbi:hypothetical protein PR003_g1773 [Phytophthora rubi]|uniref:RxLR effector protein n=1 Tax=Phytophthora rubi TaxID=129364 RepID=A0A6A3NMH2_9STRA|nr:hypothetical protein PR002_g1621 [Phytophthora rubi]KAE9051383.1 hypothetical protein PR001_g1508 [Phytophthora rubi]KAE9357510.1 hypothetical protein PR003_g1773 [Phytophthora rubi]
MRLTATLLAAAVVLLASNDNLAVTASKATTRQDGLYAELYRVEDGVVTDKMRVPLGEVEQYKESDFKQLKKKLGANEEERAAVRLPRGMDSLFKGFERFMGFFRKSNRRLRLE